MLAPQPSCGAIRCPDRRYRSSATGPPTNSDPRTERAGTRWRRCGGTPSGCWRDRRAPHPGPGRPPGRAVGGHRPGRPPPVERPRPDGVTDRRKGNGAAPKLTARRRDALSAALQKRPPDGGLWTGPKVARYVDDRWRVAVCPRPVGGGCGSSGSPSRCRVPATPAADHRARRAWKKTCGAGAPAAGGQPGEGGRGVGRGRGPARAETDHPPGVVARGAAPVVRADQVRVAVRVRVRPPGHRRHVHRRPPPGECRADGGGVAAFAAHADPDGKKVLVLVVDNAGWHRAGRLAVPANVRLHFLPPCTPELQPASRSGRWSGRPWPTTRSTAWPTCGGASSAGASGGGRPSDGERGGRLPLGRQPRKITTQCKMVSRWGPVGGRFFDAPPPPGPARLESDNCYWIANAKAVRGKKRSTSASTRRRTWPSRWT